MTRGAPADNHAEPRLPAWRNPPLALPDHLPDPLDDLEGNRPPGERPSWLVGPDEIPAPARPAGDPSTPELRAVPGGRVGLPIESRPAEAPPRPVAWTAAGNSVPRLTQVPEIQRRALPNAADEPDVERLAEDVPGPEADHFGAAPRHAAPAPRLEEPWWMVVGERLAGDRRLLAGLGIASALAIGVFALWPRSSASVHLREIHRHPERWEGRTVQVEGRIGDVFPIGSGYVFQLHQGRDTIVVFTRTRVPERRQRVQVAGEVSAGYLDGRARLAILEQATTTP